MREFLLKLAARRERRKMAQSTSWYERNFPAFAMSYWLAGGALCACNILLMMYDDWGVIRSTFPVSNAIALGACLALFTNTMRDQRRARLTERLPARISVLQRDEDEQRVAVTRNNGETTILSLPPDYDPAQDNGELLMRMIVPEIFNKNVSVNMTIETGEDEELG